MGIQSLLKEATRYGLGMSLPLLMIQLPGSVPQPDYIRSVAGGTIEQRPRTSWGHSTFQDGLRASQPTWETAQTQSDRERNQPVALESTANQENPVLPHAPCQSVPSFDFQLKQFPWGRTDSSNLDRGSKREMAIKLGTGPVQNTADSHKKSSFRKSGSREDEALFPRPFFYLDLRPVPSGGPPHESNQHGGTQDEYFELDLLSGFGGARVESPPQQFQTNSLGSGPALDKDGFQPPCKNPFYSKKRRNDSLIGKNFFQHDMPHYRTEITGPQAKDTTGAINTKAEFGKVMSLETEQKKSQDVRMETHQLGEINQAHPAPEDRRHTMAAPYKGLNYLNQKDYISSLVEERADMSCRRPEENLSGVQSSSSRIRNLGSNDFELQNHESGPLNLSQIFQEVYSTKQYVPKFTHEGQASSQRDEEAQHSSFLESHQENDQGQRHSIPPPLIRVDMELVHKGLSQGFSNQRIEIETDVNISVPSLSKENRMDFGDIEDDCNFTNTSQKEEKFLFFIQTLKKISGIEFFGNQPNGQIWTDEENAHILLEAYQHYNLNYIPQPFKEPGENYQVLKYFFILSDNETKRLGLTESIESFIESLKIKIVDAIKTNKIYVPNTPNMHPSHWFIKQIISQVRNSCKGVLLLVKIFHQIFRTQTSELLQLRNKQYQAWEFLEKFWNDFIMFQTIPVQTFDWAQGSSLTQQEIFLTITQICKHLTVLKKSHKTVKGVTVKLIILWLEIHQRDLYGQIGHKLYFSKQGWISFIFNLIKLSHPSEGLMEA